uniref:Sushi domain-containing protein n=1 Tax=Panagrellus redivivus TaxID=6233 RepID=A0A7E4WCH8_PANRE
MFSDISFLTFVLYIFTFVRTANGTPCSNGIDKTALVELNSYVNTFFGALKDHYVTTWTPQTHPSALQPYSQIDTLGLIANGTNLYSGMKQSCACLQEIIQLYDEQLGIGGSILRPGLFGRLDHKLVHAGEEEYNGVFERYMRTGEKLYCVGDYGQCGATVPLYRWFAASEIGGFGKLQVAIRSVGFTDNFITTTDSIDTTVDLNIKSKGVLCYIWAVNYDSKHSATEKLAKRVRSPPIKGIQAVSINMVEDKACPPLQTPHGQWYYTTPSKHPGTVAFLNCHPGFQPSLHASITTTICQRSYSWSPAPHNVSCEIAGCLPIVSTPTRGTIAYNMAEVPYAASNGTHHGIYPIGTTAILVCPASMDVSASGADASYCSPTGWTPQHLGTCERICSHLEVTDGTVHYADVHGNDQATNTNGTVATVICLPGTKLVGIGTATCVNGSWSEKSIGNCETIHCPALPSTNSAIYSYSNSINTANTINSPEAIVPGTIVRIQCQNARRLNGASEAICASTGEWAPKLGSCV